MKSPLCFLKIASLVSFLVMSDVVRADFIPIAGFDRQLFPSYIIATASVKSPAAVSETHLGDQRGLLGVKVRCPKANTPVTITVECSDFIEPSVYSGTLARAGVTYSITPKIKYQYKKLAKCDQAEPTSVTFRVQLGKDTVEEETVTCTMRSINDCPFAYSNGEKIVDISETFAAYVNEQHPFVDKLLREALDIGIVEGFTGYQSGNEGDVILQAYALWDLLWVRDIRYSSITTSVVESKLVASQHVRLIEDSINNSQANCVDGSVLWVSLLRKIGIDAFLIIEPTHCYVGFYAGKGETKLYALETTVIGTEVAPGDVKASPLFKKAIPKDVRGELSFPNFVKAVQVGTDNFNKRAKLTDTISTKEKSGSVAKQGDNDKSAQVEVRIINIAKARKEGILPIAFQNKESFVWHDYTEFLDEEDEATDETTEEMEAGEEEVDDKPPVPAKPTPKSQATRQTVDEVPTERTKFRFPLEKLKSSR